MKRRLIIATVILASTMTTALPQQPRQPTNSPMEQALGQKLMEEINANIQLRAQIVALQDTIKDLQAKTPEQKK